MKARLVRVAANVIVCLALLVPFSAGAARASAAPPPPGDLIGQLREQTAGQVRISYHAGTELVRFIGTDRGHAISQPGLARATPEEAARRFLADYGSLFGLQDQSRELSVLRTTSPAPERSFVRFQQVHRGVPVLGGELIVQTTRSGDVVSANGEVLPDLDMDTTPQVPASAAQRCALDLVARAYGLATDELAATEPELWIYNPLLLKPGPALSSLVWRVEVRPRDLLPIDELVLVEARSGVVVLHFNQIDFARNRRIYDNQNNRSYGLPGSAPVRTEGGGASGAADADNAYDYAGATYDFYNTYHGRDSIDGAGRPLTVTVRYCPSDVSEDCPYENAFWNGTQMAFGDGFASADDVMAHELTHGVTTNESKLFYYMQSGAISEALSDIWGEFVDQTYTNGNDDDSAGVRWLMGEDVPGGAGRSMSNPPAYSQADKMTSSFYYCGEDDRGGVHFNNGVGNKAAFLMVDGGVFNGRAITGIGMTKTAKIWYEVQTNLLTTAADYQDLSDDLQQACTNLVGTSGITSVDCQQVRKAVEAAEMDQQPSGCPAPDYAPCPAGQIATTVFLDDLEAGAGNWTFAALVGTSKWSRTNSYATSGSWHLESEDQFERTDTYAVMASGVTLPSNAYLHFNHAFAFDDFDTKRFDGGVLEYSAGGGAWTDANSLIVNNGYNGTIGNSWNNPLGGRSGFVSESNGYISSRAGLSALAGQSVRFRFRIGTSDTSDAQRYGAGWGWFIDDVRIYTCSVPKLAYLPLVFRAYSHGAANHAPNIPSGPSPADDAIDQSANVTLTWSGGDPDGDAVAYDVYLEADDATPDVLRCDAMGSASCTPDALNNGAHYYWQVVATDEHGAATAGPVWDFTTTTAVAWTIIKSEDFEGPFPAPDWDADDENGSTGGVYYWLKRTCKPYAGSNSGWAVGGGTNGSGLGCGSYYPDQADSWMVYGPFSLVGATAADLKFKLWAYTEKDHDFVYWLASTDGTNFSGSGGSGATNGWIDISLDLSNAPGFGNLLGQLQVWIAIVFVSDEAVNEPDGAYVDSIVLRKCTAPACTTSASAETQDDGSGFIMFPAVVSLHQ